MHFFVAVTATTMLPHTHLFRFLFNKNSQEIEIPYLSSSQENALLSLFYYYFYLLLSFNSIFLFISFRLSFCDLIEKKPSTFWSYFASLRLTRTISQ